MRVDQLPSGHLRIRKCRLRCATFVPKKQRVLAAFEADPGMSDCAIAEMVGMNHKHRDEDQSRN